jgi:hypothetical protein
VQNGAICLGAFRTSPIQSLQVETNELPLNLRREKLTLQCITKLKSTPDNPAYTCVFEPNYTLLFKANPSVIPTLGVRVKELLLDSLIQFECIDKSSSLSPVPPWLLKPPRIHLYSPRYWHQIRSTPRPLQINTERVTSILMGRKLAQP